MKTLIALFLLCSFPAKSLMSSELDTVRNNYRLAPEDKTVCKEMIALLENRKDPVSLAYLGAFRSIWAKHTPNPLTKLGTFRKGKKNIEAAVAAEPFNIEIRFVRLSVQLNAPGFLGYNSNIDEDKKFIMANRGTITSEVLKSMVDEIIE